ncbi:MAG TPA: tetratricopeptide repeat protein [Ktedonobacteraceae bacterium]|nr:tetratricopeptide repeat protein [Ktedonobacteraceae bacterium]
MYYLFLEKMPDENSVLDPPQAVNPSLCQKLVEDMRFVERHQLQEQGLIVEFLLDPSSLHLDYLPAVGIYGSKLCSQRFLEILKQEAVPCVAYPARLLDHHSKQVLTDSYFFLIFPFRNNVIDWERSESIAISEETGDRQLSKIVLTEACETSAPLLFCTRARYFIHERLRTQLEKANLQGMTFAPLDTAVSPYTSIEISTLQRHLQTHAEDWSSWCKLSDCFRRLGRQEEALEALSQALKLKPDEAEIWYKRGQLRRKLGRFQEALEAIEQAIQIEQSILFWNEYCIILQRLGRFDQLAVEAEKGVRLWGEDSPIPWFHLGTACEILADYENALFAANKGLELGGGGYRYDLLQLKGQVLYKLGRYEDALDTYEAGLAQNKLFSSFWSGKTTVLRALGKQEEAQAVEKTFEQSREARRKKRPS